MTSDLTPVIVNADDFGLDLEYNQLTLRAFQRQVISSATLMANMPAFEDACHLIHAHGLEGRVGLHFNLTYGEPLSQAIRAQPLFCNSRGEFDLNLRRSALRLPGNAAAAVLAELETQWQRCVEHGVRPSHIDSHQHVHNLWPIAPIVARFAASKGVPVRLARNVGGNIGLLKRLFKSALNARIGRLCRVHVRFVCTPRDLLEGFRPEGSLEVVAHPTELANGDFGDDYLPEGHSLSQLLGQALPRHKYIAYSQLAKE
jgi:predicted glycoside hydrolase/deacetylase ChbG (UPF0249 family)